MNGAESVGIRAFGLCRRYPLLAGLHLGLAEPIPRLRSYDLDEDDEDENGAFYGVVNQEVRLQSDDDLVDDGIGHRAPNRTLRRLSQPPLIEMSLGTTAAITYVS